MSTPDARSPLPHDPAWPRTGGWSPHEGSSVDAVLVGVPTSRTSLSATQAHLTPAAVREALRRYSSHLTLLDHQAASQAPAPSTRQLVLDEVLSVRDAGDCADVDTPEGEAAAAQYIAQLHREAELVLLLGGDNACTVPAVLGLGQAVGGSANVGVITLDAHHDIRDGRSNGSPIRRLIEAGVDPRRIVQIGIADFANSRVYRERAERFGITVIHRDAIDDRSIADIAAEALAIAGAGGVAVHLDVDLDVCDRAAVPGCPASIPGGISAAQLRRLVRAITSDTRVRGCDFAEVDVAADAPDGRTVRLLALAVLEALAGYALRE